MADDTPISYKWTEEDTRNLINWRAANNALFTGRRNAATKGYEAFISQYGLEGSVTPSWAKKKWENLKQKYKDLKCPKTGVSTEGGESTAASWKWYSLMDEAIGGRPSVTPPVLIASSSQDAVVCSPPSVLTHERSEEPRVTPKRRRIEANDSLYELLQEMQERDERLEREMMEREDRREREAREREERREREALLREERRDREMAARDSRFMAILERLINK